jgi:hypothetical protein
MGRPIEVADIYLHRSLNITQDQGVTVLDCIGKRDALGGMGLRVFCAIGTDGALFDPAPRAGCAVLSEVRMINGGVMLSGMVEEASSTLRIALRDGELSLPVQAPETELFDGLNTCIAERNGEPPEVLEDWLRYHVERFGLQAVLLIDREKSSKNNRITRRLKAISKRVGLTRLVHITSAMPLGNAVAPPASHPFNAPDAPGKDRMGTPKGDAWTAPLAELQLYEWARWRFLERARAVMNLDLGDILKPGADPFEQVQSAPAGVIQLLGQRVYPWRVRAGQVPRFGDHICRQFDNPRANRRWCLVPERLEPEQTWRLVRVGDAAPDPRDQAGFFRAMGIRHPDSTAAEIVPKTSLIEDPDLVKMAQEVWSHKPVRAPESKMQKAPKAADQAGRTLIVTCMKNEGPFILEWIAYHRAIGVDDFLIYTNDCDDGTDAMLDLLMKRGLVQRRDNRFHGTGVKPQHWALAASDKEDLVRDAGWIISMDVDEFINIHVGAGRLQDLYKAVGEANMISLTWRLFGNADVHGFDDRFLTDQFTRCAPELIRKPHQAWGFKTLFRNLGIYKKMGVHRPKGLKPDLWDKIAWVNGSGAPMPQKLIRNGWRSTTDSYGYDLVTLNHYAVRSAESFLVKRDRGRVNHVARDQGLNYWFRMNNNEEEDRSILDKRERLTAEYDALMADTEIAAAHKACVTAHRAKITELRGTPSYAAFYKDLTSARMQRLSRMHRHFGANVFLTGPQVVPDKIAFQDDLPDDFFFTVERDKPGK